MNRMVDEIANFSPYHPIFTDNEQAIQYMCDNLLIMSVIPCINSNCTGIMHIRNMSTFIDKKGYRCTKNKCKRICSLETGSKFDGLTIECKKILRGFFAGYILTQIIKL